jgi:KaiC/GvpD/RAD55 family RecA-like ATPase
MILQIRRAERKAKKLKAALVGVSGAGKTWTALELAAGLVTGGRTLVIDTERSSSSLYADHFDFDIMDLPDTNVQTYLGALDTAARQGYEVVVIDSLSHAWEYLLEEVDNIQKRDRRFNSFTAWSEVTPIYRQLVQKIVGVPAHVIATMRAKSDYVMEEYVTASGKTATRPVKVGLAPVFRQGGEYEFDVVANIDLSHTLVVEKTRIDFLADQVIKRPGREVGKKVREWIDSAKAEDLAEGGAGAITEAQTRELEHLAERAGVDPGSVAAAAGVSRLQDVPVGKFDGLVRRLEARVVKAKAA